MRALSDLRPPGSSPTESGNEDRFEEILTDARLPLPRRQRELGAEKPIGRCDFRDENLPLAIEVNSLTFHTTPSDRLADELRYNALCVAGFAVAVIWAPDLWRRPHAVVRTMHAGRQCAAAGKAVVLHSPGCPWPGVPVVDESWRM